MEFNIYFDNASIRDTSDATTIRTVQAFDHASMFAAFDALCKSFMCVVVYSGNGELVRKYDNPKTMGI